ncbi:hypothetical protein [Nocardia sp. IFM 10818]
MTNLAARAEVIKLARELHTAPEDLAFLLDSDPAAIRRVRQGMHHSLDARYRPMFQRVARVSALVPDRLSITIAIRFFGPMLCGMIASSLSPARATALIGHIPRDFLADVAAYVDPEAATPIVRAFDTDILVPVMQDLLRRKDFVTLARFLVAATDEQLLGVLPHIESGEDLLMVGFNAELDAVSDRFELVLGAMPEHRVRDLLQSAHDLDRFAEALTFLQFLTPETLGRVADIAAEMGPELLTHMVDATRREVSWAELIPVAATMSPDNRQRFLDLEIWDAAALTAMAEEIERSGHWPALLEAVDEKRATLD